MESLPADLYCIIAAVGKLSVRDVNALRCASKTLLSRLPDAAYRSMHSCRELVGGSHRLTCRAVSQSDAWTREWMSEKMRFSPVLNDRPNTAGVAIGAGRVWCGADQEQRSDGLCWYPLKTHFSSPNETWATNVKPVYEKWSHGDVKWLECDEPLLLVTCANRACVFRVERASIQECAVVSYETDDKGEEHSMASLSMARFWDASRKLLVGSRAHTLPGVKLFDLENRTEVRSFEHRPNGVEMEMAIWGQRDTHEINTVLPHHDNHLFVSASYRYLYLWDVRQAKMVHRAEFYPPFSGGAGALQNQESSYPLQCVGWTNPTFSRLTAVGTRVDKCVSYDFPSMRILPEEESFQLGVHEVNAMAFAKDGSGYAGCNVYGSFFVGSTFCRRETQLPLMDRDIYTGSGANGCAMSSDGKWLAFSAGNIGSGGMGQILSIASIAESDPEELPPLQCLEREKEKKKCICQ